MILADNNEERWIVMNSTSLLQIIYFVLGAVCLLTWLVARSVVSSVMTSMEYDSISHAFTWVFLSPIGALGLYFWWVALSL